MLETHTKGKKRAQPCKCRHHTEERSKSQDSCVYHRYYLLVISTSMKLSQFPLFHNFPVFRKKEEIKETTAQS